MLKHKTVQRKSLNTGKDISEKSFHFLGSLWPLMKRVVMVLRSSAHLKKAMLTESWVNEGLRK